MPIPVAQVTAAFDQLNAETDKTTYAINISDSKHLNLKAAPGSEDEKSKSNNEWEFLISIDPQQKKGFIPIQDFLVHEQRVKKRP